MKIEHYQLVLMFCAMALGIVAFLNGAIIVGAACMLAMISFAVAYDAVSGQRGTLVDDMRTWWKKRNERLP